MPDFIIIFLGFLCFLFLFLLFGFSLFVFFIFYLQNETTTITIHALKAIASFPLLFWFSSRAACSSGLGLWYCNPEVPGLRPPPCLFTVAPSSNSRSRFVNSRLVCLLPVGIFIKLCYVYLKYLFPLFQWCVC